MSYPKLTPIIAKGATEPRYLEDRFADIVNIKDFGAKGDGVTDDTDAFLAACSLAGKDVIVPYTNEGYVVKGTIPVHCNLHGQGNPVIKLTVVSPEDRGFWMKSESGISNIIIEREVVGSDWISGEYTNALVVGEYYTDGTEYKNIHINNVELVGVDHGEDGDTIDRRSIMGIYGNAHDIFINNLTFKGYVTYGLMCHWGGVFDPEDPAQSPVTASWHPRRVYINGIRMTDPEPDSGVGMLYLSACHDFTVSNLTADGISNPITIAAGDAGGLVAQGESKDLVFKNIRFENVSLRNFSGTGFFISGYSAFRGGTQWVAIDNNSSVVVDGITVVRGALSTNARCIDMCMVKNVEITGMNLSHEGNIYADIVTPALYIRACDNIHVEGSTLVPFAHEVVGSTNVVLKTSDKCLRSDYTSSCTCTRLTGQRSTETLASNVAVNDTVVKLTSLGMDLIAGSIITIGTYKMTLTKSVVENTGPVDLYITPSLTSASASANVTVDKALGNIELYGDCYGFNRGVFATNLNNGSAKNLYIMRNMSMTGTYDIDLQGAQNVSILNCIFNNGGQTDASSASNIRLTDSCKDVDIQGCSFENNNFGTCKVRYNIYTDNTIVGGVISENKFFNVQTESIHVYIPSGLAAPSLIVTDNWFDSSISNKYTVSGMVRKSLIGDKQICFYAAAPTVGTWNKGDIIFNSNPVASGSIGWVCVTAGTPGTWKTFGTISS